MRNEGDAFQLGYGVCQLSLQSTIDTPVVDANFLKNTTKALATALGIYLDVEALLQPAHSGNRLEPIFQSFEIAHSKQVMLCFKFGFVFGSYVAFRGLYPLGGNRTQEAVDKCERDLREAASYAGISHLYLEEIVKYCKNSQVYEPKDEHLSKIVQETFPKIVGYFDSREVKQNGKRNISILFLAANPKDTNPLRLGEEIQAIDQALRQTEFRDTFDIKQHWALRVGDLHDTLLRYRPDIVHFSGHGSPSSEILLEDTNGYSHPVSSRALSEVFRILRDNIRCVVLNTCYSEQQAQAIAQHIDCVAGMSSTIGDTAARGFAVAFYRALGYGRSIKTAFELGCAQIDLENLNEQDIPKLLAVNSNPNNIILVDKTSRG